MIPGISTEVVGNNSTNTGDAGTLYQFAITVNQNIIFLHQFYFIIKLTQFIHLIDARNTGIDNSIIIAICIGIFVLMLAAFALWMYCRKRKGETTKPRGGM